MKINIQQYINNFGFKIFMIKAIRKKFYNNYSSIGKKINLYNEKNIKDFLYKKVFNEIDFDKKTNFYRNNTIVDSNVIWTMWWQGEEQAPDIVKACLKKLKEKNSDYKVIVLSKANLSKYLKLDPKIYKLLKNGKISFTHFSDIVRVNLLYIYGGAWVDSTIYSTQGIPNEYFKKDFFSIKTGNYTNDPSHGRWTTFFLIAKKDNPLFKDLTLLFNKYIEKYDIFIDYILFDYFIEMIYENNEFVRKEIDDVEINNKNVFLLKNHLNDIYSLNWFKKDTRFYKLTYKFNFKINTGKSKTVYQTIIEDSANEK